MRSMRLKCSGAIPAFLVGELFRCLDRAWLTKDLSLNLPDFVFIRTPHAYSQSAFVVWGHWKKIHLDVFQSNISNVRIRP